MKFLAKVMTVLLLAVMIIGLLPVLNAPVSAASIPVLVLDSTTATAPILDHLLDLSTYGSGGPFTVTYEWKCNLKSNNPNRPDSYASVQSIGTIYGSLTQNQPESGIRISGNTDWTQVSYTFQNVGTYPMPGTNEPGNVFRFRIHDSKGQLYVKNLVIKNAAGSVVYSLNNDSVVQQLVSQMEADGLTQVDMSELAAINFDACPWIANQFETGQYTSYVMLDSATPVTTSSITRPTTSSSTTSSSTTKTTTSSSTTKTTTSSSTTIKPTTVTTSKRPTVTTQNNPCVGGHKYELGACINCGLEDPYYDPCLVEHTFQNGYCIYCAQPDPQATTPTTTAATTTQTTTATTATTATQPAPTVSQDSDTGNGSDNGWPLLLLLALIMVLLGLIAFVVIKLLKK